MMLKKRMFRQFIAASSATMVFFITGCHIGWSAPILKRLENGELKPHISSDEVAWVVSIFLFAQSISSVPAGYFGNVFGRKLVLIVGTFPLFLGSWIMIALAHSVEVLYAARVAGGLAVGISFTIAPMYLSEIAEDQIRGSLGTLFQFMLSLGIMFEYAVGPYTSLDVLGYVSAIFPVVFLATFIWMPESPYYYLFKNRRKDAEKSLLWLRSEVDPASIQNELNGMEKFVEEDRAEEGGIKDIIFDRAHRKALIITVSLVTLQNFSGNLAMLSYATHIFEESKTDLDSDISVMILGGIQVLLSIVSSSVVDIAGRRPMMIFSSIGCGVFLVLEGLFFYLKYVGNDLSSLGWLPLTGMIGFIVFYTMGLGPIPIAIPGELFPTRLKGVATSITSVLLGLEAAAVAKLFQVISEATDVYVVFWIFASSCVVAAIFSFFVLPETKGKSLMDIHRQLST